jgi:hypothetical protein
MRLPKPERAASITTDAAAVLLRLAGGESEGSQAVQASDLISDGGPAREGLVGIGWILGAGRWHSRDSEHQAECRRDETYVPPRAGRLRDRADKGADAGTGEGGRQRWVLSDAKPECRRWVRRGMGGAESELVCLAFLFLLLACWSTGRGGGGRWSERGKDLARGAKCHEARIANWRGQRGALSGSAKGREAAARTS